MNEIDRRIREALRADEAKELESLGAEPSLNELIIATFRGRSKWLVMAGYLFGFILLALGIFAGVQFYLAQTDREMLAWAMALAFCSLAIMAVKIWYWMELNKHALIREIKRVELQLALVASRLGKPLE